MADEVFERRGPIGPPKETVAAKWSANILDEGYVPVPKRLIRCLPKIFAGDGASEQLAVVLAIVDYRRPKLVRQPSLGYLAFVAGMDVSRFAEVLQDLETAGLLKVGGDERALTISLDGLIRRIQRESSGEE